LSEVSATESADADGARASGRTATAASRDRPSRRSVLLIGEGQLADATRRSLESGGAAVTSLRDPSDSDVRDALEPGADSAVVIARSDVAALRFALGVAYVRPGLPLLVTIFSRRMAAEVEATVQNVRVISMGDIVAPPLAGPCLDPDLLAVAGPPGDRFGAKVREGESAPSRAALDAPSPGWAARAVRRLESIAQPFDASARILMLGLVGVLAVLLVETIGTSVALGVPIVEALYTSAKVVVTVGPSPPGDQAPEWFKLFATVAMLLALGFTAVLTAGLVDRLLDRRLTGIFGRAAVPRRGHAVVVGLGQVGFRLCQLLRQLGVPVVAVERDPDADNIARAKDEKIPVVVGSGGDGRLLRRLSLDRARALASVTSDELENIAIAVAARAVRRDLHIALRAGDGEATDEIRALFGIGVVRDVDRIAGTALAAIALGSDVREAFPYEGTMFLVDGRGEIEAFATVPAADRERAG
jgi:voltage-gated potassium channel Kch